MREDVKLLKDQGIHSYCVCGKYIDGEYKETHFEFNAWVQDLLFSFKAVPTKENTYNLYYKNKRLRKDVNILEFGTKISRMKKHIILQNDQKNNKMVVKTGRPVKKRS